MGTYSYKYASARIPDFIKDDIDDYEGGCDYDGDMWIAVSNYIDELEDELKKQYALTKKIHSERLMEWLKNRPKSYYVDGPMIIGD